MLENTRAGKIIPPQTYAKDRDIPRSLAQVALKAMVLDPEKRYKSVVELQREITRYLTGFPTSAERAGNLARLSLLVRRHNRVAALVMVFLLALAAIISSALVAIAQKSAAETVARKQAEKNFQLYHDQQAEAQKLYDDLSASTRFAISIKHYAQAKEIIRALEIGLEKETDPAQRSTMLLQKGTVHFVLEQFNRANQCFDKAGNGTKTTETWHRLSQKYAALKPNDSDLLSRPQLIELLNEKKTQASVILYVYFHHMRRMPACTPKQYLPIAKAALDRLYPSWGKPPASVLKLEKTSNGYVLDLSDAPYTTYALGSIGMSKQNILTPFNLYALDISHLPITDLAELAGLHLQELRMVGLHIKKPFMMTKQIGELSLERLIIDTPAYSQRVLNLLREICEVVDDPESL